MCILFLALNQHPHFPVVICANRDEFHKRPTQAMHFWPTQQIYAGKDLSAGGTWLAIDKQLQFSALTNYRQLPQENKEYKSRGDLVINAMQARTEHMEKFLLKHNKDYAGFNLIYGKLPELKYFDSIQQKSYSLSDGFHSICNGAMDDIWPKMAKGQQALTDYINNSQNQKQLNTDLLFELMTDQSQAPDQQLPKTGVSIEWERKLSSIFIQSQEYGTRSTCLILVNKYGEVNLMQREFSPSAEVISQQVFRFAKEES